jgi:CRISPR-associated endonuclease/helicase Cas3
VNRRTVVDQTTREVERIKANLRKVGLDSELAVSTLRGQFLDNRAWSADPSSPAVICGTVDMIGSRLLFGGYGAGFKTRPLLAGFLGVDSLVIHDEAHLEPAFQVLLEAIVDEQRREPHDALSLSGMRVIELTATSRNSRSEVASSSDLASEFVLSAADRADPTVRKRLHATKRLSLREHGPKDLVEKVVARALEYKDSGEAVLVFLRTVDAATKAEEALKKVCTNVRLLTGTMRGRERDRLARADPVFLRFLPANDRGPMTSPGTVFLVSTSAGEVGVNISADHLISDLSTFESMAQRLGRVNRFGECDHTEVTVFHPAPSSFDEKDVFDLRLARTLALLQSLGGEASSDHLMALDAGAKANAFAPLPQIMRTSDMLFDAWSLTTIPGVLPGRPPLAPYLHGVAAWEPPQTKVAWRDEVDLISGSPDARTLLQRYPAESLLDDFPLKPRELLTDATSRVVNTLSDALAKHDDDWSPPVWVITDTGVDATHGLRDLLGSDKKRAEQKLAGVTLLLSPKMLPPDDGFLRARPVADEPADVADLMENEAPPPTEGERAKDDIPILRRFRKRSESPMRAPPGMRRIRCIELSEPREEQDNDQAGPDLRFWNWFESARSADGEGSSTTTGRVLLDVHLDDVAGHAARITERLGLATLGPLVVKAGRLHDLGKRRQVWQRSIGNVTAPPFLAKGDPAAREREGTQYRHELGSLLDEETANVVAALSEHERDLVLHLVAAHHGRARPHFPERERFDPEAHGLDGHAVGYEVLRRFARLQRRYGRWGLAYLESLLRAADYAASAAPSKVEDEE